MVWCRSSLSAKGVGGVGDSKLLLPPYFSCMKERPSNYPTSSSVDILHFLLREQEEIPWVLRART